MATGSLRWVEHLRTGVRTCYEVDEQTTYWTPGNNRGGARPYPERWRPRTPPTPILAVGLKGFGPLTRASRGARLSACMRNSGKKRGSTGDPLFGLKTSRGRPSRRAVCAACRGGWDRPPGRRRSRSAGCSRVDVCRRASPCARLRQNMQIHSVEVCDAAASIMWSVTIDASMSEMFLLSYLTGPRLGGVGADDDGRRGAEIARAARKAFHALLRLHDHQPLGLAVGARGATRPASRIRSSFSGSTCLERYLRQAYRFFCQFQKIHLQRF